MHAKLAGVLCGMILATQATAEILQLGLEGSKEGDIQNVTIVEYAPHGRAVTLTKTQAIKAFVDQFERWSVSAPQNWKRDFFNMFPVRYIITVQRPGSSYTLYLAVVRYEEQRLKGHAFEPCIRFVLFSPKQDASFLTYLEGVGRSLNEQETPFEHYLSQLFPQI